jgi:ribosomal protein S18 acetylase RimI-like enzyme
MVDASAFSVTEALPDGRSIEIRAIRHDDTDELLAAVKRASSQSMYRRFFGVKRSFTTAETTFFVNVDFITHVALVVVANEGGRPTIVGGGRYVVDGPGKAELAVAVIDEYQGLGIGPALLRHLTAIADESGIEELFAEVLPDNKPMLNVFARTGFLIERRGRVVHVVRYLAK